MVTGFAPILENETVKRLLRFLLLQRLFFLTVESSICALFSCSAQRFLQRMLCSAFSPVFAADSKKKALLPQADKSSIKVGLIASESQRRCSVRWQIGKFPKIFPNFN